MYFTINARMVSSIWLTEQHWVCNINCNIERPRKYASKYSGVGRKRTSERISDMYAANTKLASDSECSQIVPM